MSVVVQFNKSDVADDGSLLFLPFRKGGSGLCQNISILSIAGAYGTRLESSSFAVRVLGGEEVGLDIFAAFSEEQEHASKKKVLFDPLCVKLIFFYRLSALQRAVNPFLNVSYVCAGGMWHYSVFNSDNAVVAHVYRVGLMLLSQVNLVRCLCPISFVSLLKNKTMQVETLEANVIFPFNVTASQVFTDAAIPSVLEGPNRSVTRFDGVKLNQFQLAFSFDSQVYVGCGSSHFFDSSFLKYGLIGGAIVGAIALGAAVSWLIVKRVIKRKVNPPAFELLGEQIDVLTDGEQSQSDMETSRDM